jgi:uncharacterized lipoprotein YmbA
VITARNDRLPVLALAAGLATLLAACASKPSRFYTLESTAAATDRRPVSCSVIVGPVTIPASVDRPEIVAQVGPNQVELLEFDRWASPLGDAVARAVAGDLSTLLGTPRVATAPLANFVPDYRVTLDVQRFEATPGDAVRIDTVWVVKQNAGGRTRSGQTVTREPVHGQGYDALAGAFSRALAMLASDVAAAIRADQPGPR